MAAEQPPLNRLEVLRALKFSNWEAVFSTTHLTLTSGAFQTGFALWLGANNFWMGVLASFPTFAGLSQIVSSYFVEKRGERKWFTAWFAGASRCLWFLVLLIPFVLPPALRFSAFVVLLLLASVLASIPVPAFTSWMSDLVPPEHRGRYFGRRNMLAGITTMIVSLPAAWFLDLAVKRHLFSHAVGFAALFGVAVVCGILSTYCLSRQAEPPMRRSEAGEVVGLRGFIDFYRQPFREANFRRLMLFSTLFATAQFFAAPFYLVYALTVLKLDYVWLQIFATLAGLGGLLSIPLWGYLSDKFGTKPLLGIAVFGTGLLPLLWVCTDPGFMTLSLVIICVNNFLGGLFWAGVNLTQFNMLIGVTPAERKTVYVGAMSAATGLAGGIAPIVGGVLVTALEGVHFSPLGWEIGNYRTVFLINGIMRFSTLFALGRVSAPGTSTAREVLTQLGSARVAGWRHIRQLQKASTETGKREAAQALRSSKTALAVEELIAALDDPSLHVREEAAEALGDIGDARAVKALIAHLDDPASGIVDEAAESLGRIGDPRAVGPLAKLLAEGDKSDRVVAARAMGRLGVVEAVPPLLEVVREGYQTGSVELLETCVRALGMIGEAKAVPALIALLPESGRTMRQAVVRALGDIGDRSATAPLQALLKEEQDQAVIAHTALALAMVGAESAVRPILEALDRVESPVARKQMLNSVGALIGEAEAVYPALAHGGFERDQLVSRTLLELAQTVTASEGLSGRRRTLLNKRALDPYLAGDYKTAVAGLVRMAAKHRANGNPADEVLCWAVEAVERRKLAPQEFLLALFAVKRLVGTG